MTEIGSLLKGIGLTAALNSGSELIVCTLMAAAAATDWGMVGLVVVLQWEKEEKVKSV